MPGASIDLNIRRLATHEEMTEANIGTKFLPNSQNLGRIKEENVWQLWRGFVSMFASLYFRCRLSLALKSLAASGSRVLHARQKSFSRETSLGLYFHNDISKKVFCLGLAWLS